MTKYENSKIYKLINNEMPNMVYYGSTSQSLTNRLSTHKAPCNTCSSKLLFEYGTVEIILLENYPCNSKDELIKRERYYIEGKECINKIIPGRSDKEYYADNKEQILLKRKKHYQNNKEKILLRQRQYDNGRKEERKKYLEANKASIALKNKEKFECECGGKYTHSHQSCHKKTKKHLKHVNIQNNLFLSPLKD